MAGDYNRCPERVRRKPASPFLLSPPVNLPVKLRGATVASGLRELLDRYRNWVGVVAVGNEKNVQFATALQALRQKNVDLV